MLNEAVNDDIILTNPLNRVVLSKLLNKKISQTHYVLDPLNRKEIHTLLMHAQEQFKHFVQFGCFTGLRLSELMALEWRDVDWNQGIVHISRAVVARQVKTTKTPAGQREVLLLPPALEALHAQKAYTFKKNHRVFHNPLHNQPWVCDAHIRQPHWLRLFRLAGVRYRNPYQMRHSFASLLLSAGENRLWVSQQMGHRDVEMVMKTYGKWLPNTDVKTGYQPIHNWENALVFGAESTPAEIVTDNATLKK